MIHTNVTSVSITSAAYLPFSYLAPSILQTVLK